MDQFIINGKKMKKHIPPFFIFLFLQIILISGCSRVATYNINIAYEPQSMVTGLPVEQQKFVVTAALFNDERTAEDLLMVGKRVKFRGEEVPVKAFVPLGLSVASAIKEYLFRAGYTVGGNSPSWNGNVHSMDKSWGDIVVGGTVKELDITSTSGFSMVEYVANVKLDIIIGDIKKGEIVYTTTVESSTSVKDVRFSQKKMADALNSVLSSVIENVFSDGRLVSLL